MNYSDRKPRYSAQSLTSFHTGFSLDEQETKYYVQREPPSGAGYAFTRQLVTTAPAATMLSFPIVTPGRIVQLARNRRRRHHHRGVLSDRATMSFHNNEPRKKTRIGRHTEGHPAKHRRRKRCVDRKNVPPSVLVAGVPARVIRTLT